MFQRELHKASQSREAGDDGAVLKQQFSNVETKYRAYV